MTALDILDDLDRSMTSAVTALDHLERADRNGPLDLRGPRRDLATALDGIAEALWADEALVLTDRPPIGRATPTHVLRSYR